MTSCVVLIWAAVPDVSDGVEAVAVPLVLVPAEWATTLEKVLAPETVWVVLTVQSATHVPWVPATVQIQMVPDWSTIQSPIAKVPDVGAPLAVAPTKRVTAAAPVSPPVTAGRMAPIRDRSPAMLL